jgi:hypothetical protein
MIELDAYAADCRLYGYVEFGEGRVSDQLNSTLELHIQYARLEDLADGHVVEMPELIVACDELCAVVASGPRGDTARRLHTQTTRVEVEVGPYRVHGRVHGTSASEPLGWVLRRAAWVPLTEATVMYRRGADDVSEEVATLLVNRQLMRSFRAVEEVRLDLPWEVSRAAKAAASGATGSTGTPREGARPIGEEAHVDVAAREKGSA